MLFYAKPMLIENEKQLLPIIKMYKSLEYSRRNVNVLYTRDMLKILLNELYSNDEALIKVNFHPDQELDWEDVLNYSACLNSTLENTKGFKNALTQKEKEDFILSSPVMLDDGMSHVRRALIRKMEITPDFLKALAPRYGSYSFCEALRHNSSILRKEMIPAWESIKTTIFSQRAMQNLRAFSMTDVDFLLWYLRSIGHWDRARALEYVSDGFHLLAGIEVTDEQFNEFMKIYIDTIEKNPFVQAISVPFKVNQKRIEDWSSSLWKIDRGFLQLGGMLQYQGDFSSTWGTKKIFIGPSYQKHIPTDFLVSHLTNHNNITNIGSSMGAHFVLLPEELQERILNRPYSRTFSVRYNGEKEVVDWVAAKPTRLKYIDPIGESYANFLDDYMWPLIKIAIDNHDAEVGIRDFLSIVYQDHIDKIDYGFMSQRQKTGTLFHDVSFLFFKNAIERREKNERYKTSL